MNIYIIKIIVGVLVFTTVINAEQQTQKPNPKLDNKTKIAEISQKDVVMESPSREGVTYSTKVPLNQTTKEPTKKIPSISPSFSLSNTVTETVHKTKGRKGAIDNITPKQMNTTVEHPVKPKKPTITVPGGNESIASIYVQSGIGNSTSKLPKVINSNILNNSQDNSQKYIVPIVIVILSVPFVAILISVVYKRGAEWWKYRHYRRMDFLINGMYDN